MVCAQNARLRGLGECVDSRQRPRCNLWEMVWGLFAVILDLSSFLTISLSIGLLRIGKHFLCCLWKQTLLTYQHLAWTPGSTDKIKIARYTYTLVYTYIHTPVRLKQESVQEVFHALRILIACSWRLPIRPGHNWSTALSTMDVTCCNFLNLSLCYVRTIIV